jgi:hypothetical protein
MLLLLGLLLLMSAGEARIRISAKRTVTSGLAIHGRHA